MLMSTVASIACICLQTYRKFTSVSYFMILDCFKLNNMKQKAVDGCKCLNLKSSKELGSGFFQAVVVLDEWGTTSSVLTATSPRPSYLLVSLPHAP